MTYHNPNYDAVLVVAANDYSRMIKVYCICGSLECYYTKTFYTDDLAHHPKPKPEASYQLTGKIGAIKLVRTALQHSLKEAKDFVDASETSRNSTEMRTLYRVDHDSYVTATVTHLPGNDHNHKFCVAVTWA